MYGLHSRSAKEKLLKKYKQLMRESVLKRVFDKAQASRLEKQAYRYLDAIEQLD